RRPARTARERDRRDRPRPRRAARRPHLRPLRHRGARPARPRRRRDPRDPPGDDLHRHPHGPAPARRMPDGDHRHRGVPARRRRARGGDGRRGRRHRRGRPPAVPRLPRPRREPSRGPRGPVPQGAGPARHRGPRHLPPPAARGGARGVAAAGERGADRTGGPRGRRHRRRPPRRPRRSRRDRRPARARRRERHLPRPRPRGARTCETPRGRPGDDPGAAGGGPAPGGELRKDPAVPESTPRTTLVTTKSALREHRAAMDGTVAAVLTMGSLHAGHLALVERARELADHVILTDFVNPLQFGPGEDYEAYPRDLEADLALVDGLVDLVFAPGVEEMYPVMPPTVSVSAGRAGTVLEGAARPGHFDGVVTVVAKLLRLTDPHLSVFGRKDAQQLAIIQRLVADLDLPVRIEPVEIQREE